MTSKISKLLVSYLSLVCLLLFSSNTWAHPGHGQSDPSQTLQHYLGEPVHSTPLLIVLVATTYLVTRRLSRKFRNDQH